MQKYRNCRNCNTVFISQNNDVLCERCKDAEDEIYKKIQECIAANPGISIANLSSELNISLNTINQFYQNNY